MGAFPMEDKIPRLEKFCWCMDLRSGARNGAFFLIVWNVLYLISALATTGSSTGSQGWSIFFTILNIVAWVLVIVAFQKGNPKLLIPGMIVCLFDVVTSIITAVLFFITIIMIPSAIIVLIFAALTAYYFVCLKNNYDDMSSGAAEPAPAETKPQNPV